jgi:serine acetyltransferase
MEVRPKTRIGAGLSIYHGYGLVLNDHCVIGEDVVLRNGVTIGNKHEGGGVPVLGDRVEVGAGAIILGEIELGSDCKVGAGSVVLKSFPAGSTLVGNPAHPLEDRELKNENRKFGHGSPSIGLESGEKESS